MSASCKATYYEISLTSSKSLTTVILGKFGKYFGMFCLLYNRLCTEQAFHLDEAVEVLQNCEFLALRKNNNHKTFNNKFIVRQ